MFKLLYKKRTLYSSLFLLLIIEISQQFLDYVYGDGNGQIQTFNIVTYVAIIQSTLLITIITYFNKLSKNIIVKNILNTFSLLIFIEIIFLFFTPSIHIVPFKSLGTITNGYRVSDDLLGYIPLADTSVSSIRLSLDKDTIYSVTYSTDEKHRRVCNLLNDTASKHALFFGCSFTFGEGVNDNENLPFYFHQKNPNYKPYNYGFNGYGPQQMLVYLKDKAIEKDINEQSGFAFYLYIPDHIRRVSGSMTFYTSYGANHPYFYLDNRDSLLHNKTFKTGRNPITNISFNYFSRLRLLQYFNVDLYPINSSRYKLTAEIINKSYSIYNSKFPNGIFVIILYKDDYFDKIKSYLDKNIETLNYTELPKSVLHAVDGHPNKTGYLNIANKLTEDLKQK